MGQFKLNQMAPDFTLKSTAGEQYNFSKMIEESGEDWQLIVFFRGSWCPACMKELKEFEEEKKYFDSQQIRLTTVTYDDREKLQNMVEEHGFTFPVLVDENLDFLRAYDVHFHGEDAPYEDHGTHGEPAYFLVDNEGKLLYQQRQTSPFGRPHPKELRKIIQYIGKNLKQKSE
ncbi:peroxiredoxin family protein [Salimicrobium jeotgali]|uniref:peroxiredoxin family protein n=1 Tax=Salimicrobium jeotgali TaxID=1230341 RepID=UPI0035B522CC